MSDTKTPDGLPSVKSEKDLLLDHNYDGIQELDHVLPRWWLGIFYSTIVFAAFYSGYYLAGNGPSSRQELAQEMKEIEARKPAPPQPLEGEDQALRLAFKDPMKLKHGGEVFTGKCAACHVTKAKE